MRIKAIASIVKDQKSVYLYDGEDGSQYIGSACAIYPVVGLPRMIDEPNVFTVLDIPQDKWSGYSLYRNDLPYGICAADAIEDERPIEPMRFAIAYAGESLLPVVTQKGCCFLHEKHLKPIDDTSGMMMLYERHFPSGEVYIAVKVGLMLAGIIVPDYNLNPGTEEGLLLVCRALQSRAASRDEG